jgi:DNA-binding NarL/FixJ family response regulator
VPRDSSFARLMEAWNAGGAGRVVEMAKRGLGNLARRTGLAEREGVLWLQLGDAALAPPPAVSSLRERKNFRIECVQPAADDNLEALLRRQHPRLVVAEVEWCEQVGLATIRRLHRHTPQVDWLLCWNEPSPRWLELLVQCGARGAIERGAQDSELARAFDAVLAEEIWLPRRVLQWLYATLVDAPSHEPPSAVPSSMWPAESELTPRESQVVVLLRQGLTNREIAARLGVSINTVKKHVASAFEKRGIRSRRQTLR